MSWTPTTTRASISQELKASRPFPGSSLINTRSASKTSAADLVWGQALNVDADLQATLNKDEEALALARKAKEAALS